MTIRRFEPPDWPAVVAVLEATYGASDTRAGVYEHWNLRCPVAGSGFVVAEVEGRVVGAQPMLIHEWRTDGLAVRGGVLTGVVVDPRFRRRGVFSALVRACEREAWSCDAEFIVTMPNERSRPGFLRLGWTDLGGRSLLLRHPLVSRAACRGVEDRDGVAEDLEALAESHRASFGGLGLGRTAEWWRWRFDGHPAREYLQVGARDASGRPAGLAAGVIRKSRGIPVGYLVDFLASSREALVRVACGLTKKLAVAGAVAVVSVVSSPAVEGALRDAGFHKFGRILPLKTFHTVARFRQGGGPVEEKLRAVQAWNLTLGDWDNI
jgi:GNAT superfamily N-acetyltransferase